MDVEFTVQDVFALTRPQWKFAATMEEASKAFHLAVAQDQKSAVAGRAMEVDEASSGPSSEDEHGDADDVEVFGEGDEESDSEEAEEGDVSHVLGPPFLGAPLLTLHMRRTQKVLRLTRATLTTRPSS